MANFAVLARFNESKHQMNTDSAANGVPLANILGTNFGLLAKDTISDFNQNMVKSAYYDVLDWARDQNVLERIKAGEFGVTGHVLVAQEANGNKQIIVVADYAWWAAAPEDSISVAIPIEAGWVKDGATIYLDNIGKRTFEKARETFLIHL